MNQNRTLTIGGTQATAEELSSLKAEAEYLKSTRLWSLLQETPKALAHESIFTRGETLVDVQKGRSMLYHLRSQEAIVDTLASYQPERK